MCVVCSLSIVECKLDTQLCICRGVVGCSTAWTNGCVSIKSRSGHSVDFHPAHTSKFNLNCHNSVLFSNPPPKFLTLQSAVTNAALAVCLSTVYGCEVSRWSHMMMSQDDES